MMKRVLALVLAVALLLGMAAFADDAPETVIYAHVVSKENGKTPLYQLPGEYRTVLEQIANNTQITVIFEGSTWHKVRVTSSGKEGWMKADEVAITTRGTSALNYSSTLTGAKQIRSSDGWAALRWGPGTEYDVIDQLPVGRYCWTFETVDGWTRILLEDGRIGYVSANLLTGGVTRLTEWPTGLCGYVQVSGNSANFRDAASYSSNVIGQLYSGDVVEILGEYNYFLYVYDAARNRYGYISDDIISPEGINRVAYSAYLYYDNPYNYVTDVLWSAPVGQTVKVLATDGYVSRIQYGDVVAYIEDCYLAY